MRRACLSVLICALFLLVTNAFEKQSQIDLSSGNLDIKEVASGNAEVTPSLPKAVIIPVKDEFDPLLLTTVKRRTEEAKKQGIKLIIYKVNSPGGYLHIAFELSNYVFNLPDDIKTIAFVDQEAISAAALFSLACDDLYMKANSSIGDCEPITVGGADGYKTLGSKIQSPLRERFRSFAIKNGYPVLLAEAMVTAKLKVYRLTDKDSGDISFMRDEDYQILNEEEKKQFSKREIVSHGGELLTLTTQEAIDLGFSEGTLPTAKDLVKELGYEEDVPISNVTETEAFIDKLDKYSGLFIVIAIFCLYLELKTPGIGIFGAASAVSFAIFFIGKFYTGQANYMEVTLFVLGMALLALELFVFPGFGLAGLAGFILIIASLTLAMQDFSIPNHKEHWSILISNLSVVCGSFLIATLVFGVILFLMPHSGIQFLPGLVHSKNTPDSQRQHKYDMPEETPLIGKRGISITPLMPGGKIDIDGKHYQVAAKDGWVDKGVNIQVVSQEGNQITVEKIDQEATS